MQRKSILDKTGIVIFLIPAIILFSLFFIYPIGFVIANSFNKWDGIGDKVFVGFMNYKVLYNDDVFGSAVRNNILWSCSGGLIHVPLATLGAMILAKKPRGWKFFRTIYFFPNIISIIALSMMWMAIYNNEYGALNALLEILGLEELQHNWLGEINTAFPAIIFSWIFNIGYFMVIMLAGISTIPNELYESAMIDGASEIRQDIHITIPMIKGTILTCMTLSMVNGLKHFESVYIMTGGGPANKTMMLSLYLFKELKNFRYGLANGAGVILMIIGVLVIIILNKVFSTNFKGIFKKVKRTKGGMYSEKQSKYI